MLFFPSFTHFSFHLLFSSSSSSPLYFAFIFNFRHRNSTVLVLSFFHSFYHQFVSLFTPALPALPWPSWFSSLLFSLLVQVHSSSRRALLSLSLKMLLSIKTQKGCEESKTHLVELLMRYTLRIDSDKQRKELLNHITRHFTCCLCTRSLSHQSRMS